jgi:hypothetical protein
LRAPGRARVANEIGGIVTAADDHSMDFYYHSSFMTDPQDHHDSTMLKDILKRNWSLAKRL